jgi:hypothetical protein
MEKVTGQLTNKETVVELWGEEFERLLSRHLHCKDRTS